MLPASDPKLCLCSIVRDEESNVSAMLSSVVDVVDYVVIIDTGSKDKTVQVLTEILKHSKIEYNLSYAEWIDFATNRNQCLELVPVFITHIVFLDADERLFLKVPNFKEALSNRDICMTSILNVSPTGIDVTKYPKIYRFSKLIHYRGKVHEQPVFPDSFRVDESYDHVEIVHERDHRGRNEKFIRDLKVCLNDVDVFLDSPGRREYYIGQCYLNLGDPHSAIIWFAKRLQIEIVCNDEERWHAGFMLGLCHFHTEDFSTGISLLLKAYKDRPGRLEPLAFLVSFLTSQNKLPEAERIGRMMKNTSYPYGDRIGVNRDLYTTSK
jgi:glycosyltransferase involved in cell wall biosynthesis